MIVLLSLQVFDDCEQNYPRMLQHNDSLQSSTATEKGTAQYLLCGIRGSLSQVFDIQIPNITVPINIGVTQIDFSLTDIKIYNLQVPELDVKLNEQNIVQLYLPNCNVDLKFQWKFQQSSYPYTTDSGSGTVVLRNGTMSGSAISEVDGVKCPGHMKVNVIKSNLEYQSLKIQLQGGQSWIFQSLIDIIMEAVQVQIAGFISSTMSAGFVKLANDVFEDGRREMNYANKKFIKDERYTDRVQIGSRFATLLFSGQTYLKENLTDEYITNGVGGITLNKFNADIQMAVKDEAFNNIFFMFHKYENAFSGKDFKCVKHPTLRFTNTAALVSILVEVNETQVEIQLIAKPVVMDNISAITGKIRFDYFPYSIELRDGIDADSLLAAVLEHMNDTSEDAAFQYNYTLMVDIRTYQVVFDASERVMRLIGDTPEECMPYRLSDPL
ncbi:Conserved_hypothetical protein [Hexamita inflata]|uniref:Lipid-binding serum glycoprotein N-terminal domain-containing protein n=1 Tax=Hexamita inflata TaxID=28002 RepID=A0AA86NND7_9EUKA|nr:Conserved hypothetical protein [Hexamita inflata]